MEPVYLVAKPRTFFRDKNLPEPAVLDVANPNRELLVLYNDEIPRLLSDCVPRDSIRKEIEKLPEISPGHNLLVKIEDADVEPDPDLTIKCFLVSWFDMYEPDVIKIFQINWLSEKYQKNAPEKTRKWIARLYEEASRWKVLE